MSFQAPPEYTVGETPAFDDDEDVGQRAYVNHFTSCLNTQVLIQ